MFKNLICFDFDGTLIETPGPETGKSQWEKNSGKELKGGWWSNKESLNTKYLDFPRIEWTHKHLVEACKQPDTYVFVATGRLMKLKNEVIDVLELNGIPFRKNFEDFGIDDLYCNPGFNTFDFKTKLFEKLIKEEKCENLTMFDDRQEHLPQFKLWARNQDCQISIYDSLKKIKIL